MSIAKQFENTLSGAGQDIFRQMNQWGLTLAVVTDVSDKEGLNRVKCTPVLPVKAGQKKEIADWTKAETDWCYVMSPFGGEECGQFFFPRVNDLVVLGYLGGDPHRPLVLGACWNSEVKPPYVIGKDGKVYNYSIKIPGGTELLLYAEPKKEKVTLTLPSGTALVVDDEKKSVTLSDKAKSNALTMDLEKGEVTLAAKTKLTLSAGKTTMVLDSAGSIVEKAATKVSLEAANIEGKASTKLAFQGAVSEVKADSTLTLQASGPASLKGVTVTIN
jgi:uncharacterized protein involved in type VI secretion and phage assembly